MGWSCMSAIIEFLQGLVAFLINIVQSIIWFVVNLPSMINILTGSIGYAPDFLVPFLTLSVSATALFAILKLL